MECVSTVGVQTTIHNGGFIMASATSAGITAMDLLTIVFIVLKLLKIIKWSWIWVLSPMWIPAAIVIVFVIIFVVLKAFSKG